MLQSRRKTGQDKIVCLGLVLAHTHGVLSLLHHRLVVLVAVGAEGITRLLGGRLLALGLHGGRDGVTGTLHLVTHMLGGRLLRVGLDSSTGLAGKRLAVGVGHGCMALHASTQTAA